MSQNPIRISLALCAAFAFGGAGSAQAAWSTDPSNNLIVAQHNSGDQTTPHMVPTPDGGFYVSWLDAGATYSIRLQRLDASGNAMWGANGILVYARHEQFVYDYGLDVDASGNALLAFDQGQVITDANGTTYLPGGNILATKVKPDGSFAWGAAGVQVSPPGEVEFLGKIAATSDGGAAVAWFNATGQAVVQKLDTNGIAQWTTTPVITESGGAYIADIHGGDNGSAILSWRGSDGGTLKAQKFASADGSSLWGSNPVVLSDGQSGTGSLQLGYAPPFVSDGAGGAVFTWYVVKGTASATTRVQHVNSAGVRQFGDNGGNGVSVSTNNGVDGSGTHVQVSPSGVYDATTGDIYVVYMDWYQTFTSFSAATAQRIDSTGARKWTDEGTPLEPYLANGQVFATAVPLPGGFIAAWSSGTPTSTTSIVAQRLNADGSFAWSSTSPAAVKTSSTSPGRLYGTNSKNGYAAFVWVDGTEGSGGTADVRAQNLRYDGLLGNAAGVAPGIPQLDHGSDSGSSNSDNITNVATPTFNGTCITSGDSIGLVVDGARVGSGACNGSAYSVAVTTPLVDGTHAVKAFEFSANSSSPYSGASSVTIVTTPPAITFSSTPPNPAATGDATFVFNIAQSLPATCSLDGVTPAACTSPVSFSGLAIGSHTFTVSATDVAGNMGNATYTWMIQPGMVTVTLDPSTDSGRSNSDNITNADPLIFNGSCTDGDSIQLYNGAAAIGAATVCANSAYSISVSGLAQGVRKIAGIATRGGVSGPATSPPLSITVIRTAPAAPAITGPAAPIGNGGAISGTAAINAIVTVSEASTVICSGLADGAGQWSCDATFSASGAHTVTATATDVAGNVSVPSAPFNLTSTAVSDLIFANGFDGP